MTDNGSASPRRYDVLSESCPTRQVITQIGSRWGLLIISALEHRTLRFSQLKLRIEGISQKVLTQNLRAMERDGIIARRVVHSAPVTVEYSLTELGRGLIGIIRDLREWSYGHIEDIERARARFDDKDVEADGDGGVGLTVGGVGGGVGAAAALLAHGVSVGASVGAGVPGR